MPPLRSPTSPSLTSSSTSVRQPTQWELTWTLSLSLCWVRPSCGCSTQLVAHPEPSLPQSPRQWPFYVAPQLSRETHWPWTLSRPATHHTPSPGSGMVLWWQRVPECQWMTVDDLSSPVSSPWMLVTTRALPVTPSAGSVLTQCWSS